MLADECLDVLMSQATAPVEIGQPGVAGRLLERRWHDDQARHLLADGIEVPRTEGGASKTPA